MARSLRKLQRRAVPLDWAARLAELSPPNPRFKYLYLVWEPGDPWDEPVNRWMIYEVLPIARLDTTEEGKPNEFGREILAQLRGPNPRELGNYYDTVLERFVRNDEILITEQAWKLFRDLERDGLPTGWAKPWWVIQGELGGHKRRFSQVEKKLLRLAGLPHEPPLPGDLDYAPFDNRVVNAIMRYDRLKSVHGNLKQMKADNLAQKHDKELEREFRLQLVAWLREQVLEVAPDIQAALSKLDAPRRRHETADEEKMERALENYVETGRTDGLVLAGS